MMKIDLPIKPFDKDGMTHNTVRLSLDYDKKETGPVLRLQTAETGEVMLRFSIFGSPNAKHVVERGWKTNNKRRMEAAFAQVTAEVTGKQGDSWKAVTDLLATVDSEVV